MRRLQWMLGSVIVVTACADRVEGDVVEEGIAPDDGADDESDDPPDERTGNFPEPAMTNCGGLPPGLDPIPGLASAWVAEGTYMATNEDGVHGPVQGVRLRLSDGGNACDEPFTAATADCTEEWGWAMTLPDSMQSAGEYALADWGGIYVENAFVARANEGCAEAGEGGGDGGTEPVDIAGSIEILSIDADCVVGRVQGIEIGGSELDDIEGGFVAMRCAAECIPQYGENDCS